MRSVHSHPMHAGSHAFWPVVAGSLTWYARCLGPHVIFCVRCLLWAREGGEGGEERGREGGRAREGRERGRGGEGRENASSACRLHSLSM